MKKSSIIILIVIAIVLVVIFYPRKGADEETARCIGENSVLYVRAGCSYCAEQKALFGSSIKYLDIIDCAVQSAKCQDIRGVPTWIINDKEYRGVQSIEKLKGLTGCSNG